MSTLGNEDVRDTETAKKRAQSMKARLGELGHQVPLTHVYEILATSCGHRNWPTMKAALSSQATLQPRDQSGVRKPVFLMQDGSEWKNLPAKGIELIYGPPGTGKTTISNAMALSFIENSLGGSSSKLPQIRIFDLEGTSGNLISRASVLVGPGRQQLVKTVRLRTDRTQSINMFDIPVGSVRPDASHRQAIADFLVALVSGYRRFAFLPNETARPDLERAALTVIDEMYRRRAAGSDRAAPYFSGNAIIDRYVSSAAGPSPFTWWEATEHLLKIGKGALAKTAQKFAVPKLSDINEIDARTLDIDANSFAQLRSAAVRHMNTFPIRSDETDLPFADADILAIDLSDFSSRRGEADEYETGVAFLLARQAFAGKLLSSSPFGETDFPDARPLVVYDDIHRIDRSDEAIRQIIRDMRERKARGSTDIRISTQRLESLPDETAGLVARLVVTRITRRDEERLSRCFAVDRDWIVSADATLTSPPRRSMTFGSITVGDADRKPEFVSMVCEPQDVWASATNPADANLREIVVSLIGMQAALKNLAEMFPNGTATRSIAAKLEDKGAYDLPPELADGIKRNVIEKFAQEIAAM